MFKSCYILAFCLVAGVLNAQSGGYEPSKEYKETLARYQKLYQAGDDYFKENNLSEAIKYYLLAVEIEDKNYRSSVAKYKLAKALTLVHKPEEALAVYARCVTWNKNFKDWHANGPRQSDFISDYAILLAKQGHQEKAKEIYYWGLRQYNQKRFRGHEPIPFLVVFDPSEGMDYWPYTKNNMVAAALMLKSCEGFQEDKIKNIKMVHELKPGWAFAKVLEASISHENIDVLIGEAKAYAKTDQERRWIEEWDRLGSDGRNKGEGRFQRVGHTMRKNSEVIQNRRKPDKSVLDSLQNSALADLLN